MNSLIIGSSSQLSYYFPEEYERISSRNINLYQFRNKFYDRVFITFAEQRLHEIKDFTLYFKVNVKFTLDLINFFKDRCNYIIVYGSSELWNNYTGEIDLNDKFDYDHNSLYTGYCISKEMMIQQIYEVHQLYREVIVLHPFNFNSVYRKKEFLFSKIFDSIINKKRIEIGNTYFYRDLVHPKYVVERSILAKENEIIGSGRLTYVNDFIRNLYINNGLIYEDYVTENISQDLNTKKKIFYFKSKEHKYSNLLRDTLEDMEMWKNKKT